MKHARLLNASERWFRLLLRLYPADFRDDMGEALVEAYRDRAREALTRGGMVRLARLWMVALRDSLRSGPGEHAYPAVSWRRAGNWGRDMEMATRRLLRSPALVAAVVGTLTVGLGGFAVVYTVVQKIVLDPMPYKDSDDLYFVWRDYRAYFDLDRGWLGGTDIAAMQKAGGVIEEAVGVQGTQATLSLREGADPAQIRILATSPRLFEVLGVAPAVGRGFAANEVGPGRPDVIVLTHDLWNRLGASPAILGTSLRLNGRPFTVIGVMAPAFSFQPTASLGAPMRADAYITFSVNLAETNPNAGSYAGMIRARHGSSPQVVAAAVDAVAKMVDQRDFKSRGLKLYPVGFKSDLISDVRPALVVLGFSGTFLVFVLMVNLATVLLSRATEREHEFAVSRALGANGVAVVRATLLEGGLLGLLGGVAASVVAVFGTRALVALAPLDLPRRGSVAVTWDVAAVIVGVGVLLGLIAATVPATWAARASLSGLLANSAVRGGGGQGRMRRGMVVAQVALSLVLLTAGGLVVRSFDRLLAADPGFRPDGLLTVRVPMPGQLIAEAADATLFQNRIHETLAALPGVAGVTATSALPLSAASSQSTVRIPGAPGNTGHADQDAPLVDYMGVRANYVEVMGMRVVTGRSLSLSRQDGVREALIDRHLANQFFPNGNATGAKIPFNNNTLTVVGVVDQARQYDVHEDGRPQLYVRAEDWGYRGLNFVMRTAGDPLRLVPDVRAAIRAIAPQLAVADVKTMDEIVGDSLRQQRISMVLVAGFAVGALLLAAMGLFGLVSGSVTRRRHELAVRLALGADHGRMVRLVVREGARLVGLGILVGVPGIYLASRLLRGVLIGVSPSDPLTLTAVGAGLALVAMVACYLPARRVLRIEPAQSLRDS